MTTRNRRINTWKGGKYTTEFINSGCQCYYSIEVKKRDWFFNTVYLFQKKNPEKGVVFLPFILISFVFVSSIVLVDRNEISFLCDPSPRRMTADLSFLLPLPAFDVDHQSRLYYTRLINKEIIFRWALYILGSILFISFTL